MNYPFRLLVTTVLSCFLFFACIKKTGPKEIQENLKTAMDLYLNHDPAIDSSKVKFTVTEVSYFEEQDKFLCEFKVRMQEKTATAIKDTSGVMTADISKDYKTVTRKN